MDDTADEQGARRGVPPVPDEGQILPLLGSVIYPHTVTPLAISQPGAVQLIDDVLTDSGLLVFVALRDERTRRAVVSPAECYTVGTLAAVHLLLRLPDGTLRIAVEGIERVQVAAFTATTPHLRGQLVPLPDLPADPGRVQQLLGHAIGQLRALSLLLPALPDELQLALASEESPERMSYLLAMAVAAHSSVAERQALLEEPTVLARLDHICELIDGALERVQRRSPDKGGAQQASEGLLERRPELWELPLVQEARTQGHVEGMRALLATLLRDRFGDEPGLAAVVARVEAMGDVGELERLALLASRATGLDAGGQFLSAKGREGRE